MINFVIGLCYSVTGIAIVLLSKPLVAHKIGPNRWYGFRFRESFSSEENWYRINEYGARRMIPWALFLAIIGLVPIGFAMLSPYSELLCGCLTWLQAMLLIPIFQAWLFAKSLSIQEQAS